MKKPQVHVQLFASKPGFISIREEGSTEWIDVELSKLPIEVYWRMTKITQKILREQWEGSNKP